MVFSNSTPFPTVITPLSNISPFTYRDGHTYLEILEKMRKWLNETLVPDFNAGIDNAIAEFQKGIKNAETRVVESENAHNELVADAIEFINTNVTNINAVMLAEKNANKLYVDTETASAREYVNAETLETRTYVDDSVQFINNKTGQAQIQRATLTAPYTVTVDPLWPSNHQIQFVLTQDATGGRSVSLGANISGPLSVDSRPNGVTEFTLIPDGAGTWKVVPDTSRVDNGGIVFADNFGNHANGVIDTRKPIIGPRWSGTGAGLPTVTDGTLRSTAVGYAWVNLTDAPDTLACSVEWVNPDSSMTMTMAWVSDSGWSLNNLGNHFNFGPNGYNVTIKRGLSFLPLFAGKWNQPMVAGQVYDIAVSIVGNRLVITANGDVHTSPADIRVKSLAGSYVFWEPATVGASSSRVHSVAAYDNRKALDSQNIARPSSLAQAGMGYNSENALMGNGYTMSQVTLGDDGADNPTLSFGATRIHTSTKTDTAVGATTFQSMHRMPSGSTVILDPGTAVEETRTTTGYPVGTSAPYTHTVSVATTYAHPALTPITATVPGGFRAMMYLNMGNGYFYLPNLPVLIAPGEKIYFGAQLDTNLSRSAAGFNMNRPLQIKGGSLLDTGTGVPTHTAAPGDLYFRTDTPTVANQRIYMCAGTNVWNGIA